ncbi:MAG TPA: exosortase-associated EpsI family protein [Candidatus Omnitrophota bacterium]|nr:exosortase-associated EpsI family protein [Candidatus Omnitrophota bacterium]
MKTRILKFAIIFTVLLAGLFTVYCTPKWKYEGKEVVLSVMQNVPDIFGRWRGRNVDSGVNDENPIYNFISKISSKFYYDLYLPERGVMFTLLDAGNFHYPKICMRGGGKETTDFAPRTINVGGKEITVQMVLAEDPKDKKSGNLTVYWISIDKKPVKEWIQHKLHQLVYSLFNRKSVGLMVRADIRCTRDNVDDGVKYVEKFFNDLYKDLPQDSREYIFGK